MKRFTWQQMRKYWENHSSQWAGIDYDRDPDGLRNVCIPDAPLWLNRYYARGQKMVYQKIFTMLPQPIGSSREPPISLDIGCGAGRWCRFLVEHGYDTMGLDLQRELIKINRTRYPNIKFVCASIQDYSTEEPVDLISSVTVIQHIPFEEQDLVIQKIRKFVKTNGYAIVLENIHDKGPHVFSNTIRGWQAKFFKAGFKTVAIQRYDYSPFLRLLEFCRYALHVLGKSALHYFVPSLRQSRNGGEWTPETLSASLNHKKYQGKFMHVIYESVQRLATGFDTIVEPIFIHSNIPLPTIHCGFLLKAI